MIVRRYLVSEVIKATLGVLLVLLCVGLSNEFVLQLKKAAAGELPVGLVLSLVAASLPTLMGTLLPLGFFLGVVFGYGRLFADSEMSVLFACGFSWQRLLKITLIPAALFSALALLVQLYLSPWAFAYQEQWKQHPTFLAG